MQDNHKSEEAGLAGAIPKWQNQTGSSARFTVVLVARAPRGNWPAVGRQLILDGFGLDPRALLQTSSEAAYVLTDET